VFKDARQRAAYNRLVYNVKKVLPIAKEVNRIIIETGDYTRDPAQQESQGRAHEEGGGQHHEGV
jgi:hypothetical protein